MAKTTIFLQNNYLMRHFIEVLIGFICGIFIPVMPYMAIIAALVLADTVGGVTAAYWRKESLTWVGFRRAFPKLIMFLMSIVVIYHFERTFNITQADYITKTLAGIIGAIELKSIDQKFKIVTGFSFREFVSEKINREKNEAD